MTPTMKLWLADADAFGLSEDVRKGLLFLLGLELGVLPLELEQVAATALLQKLSPHFPDIPEELGGNFFDGRIAELLLEVGHKLDKDFQQRVVSTTAGGEDILSYGRLPANLQLPEISLDESFTMHRWERFLTALYGKIGANIDEDAEGAYLAGLRFARAYFHMDRASTIKIAAIVSSAQLPHFTWFRYVLHLNPDEVPPKRRTQKIMQMFLLGFDEKFGQACALSQQISDLLHFNTDGSEDERIGNLNLGAFINQLGHFRVRPEAASKLSDDDLILLKEARFLNPPACTSHKEVLGWLESTVKRIWDYSLFAEEDLNPGETATRKACAILAFAVAGLMRPSWNKVLYEKIS